MEAASPRFCGMPAAFPVNAFPFFCRSCVCMSLFQWNDTFSVGNNEIDRQHKKLFELADRFHSAMAGGKGKQILQQTLTDLIDYTKHHFAAEESLMQKSSYPEYRLHKKEHDALTHKVVQFRDDLAADRAVVTIDVLQFLREWLVQHIGQMDKKVGDYIGRSHPSQKVPA
jgi:hemerythrin